MKVIIEGTPEEIRALLGLAPLMWPMLPYFQILPGPQKRPDTEPPFIGPNSATDGKTLWQHDQTCRLGGND